MGSSVDSPSRTRIKECDWGFTKHSNAGEFDSPGGSPETTDAALAGRLRTWLDQLFQGTEHHLAFADAFRWSDLIRVASPHERHVSEPHNPEVEKQQDVQVIADLIGSPTLANTGARHFFETRSHWPRLPPAIVRNAVAEGALEWSVDCPDWIGVLPRSGQSPDLQERLGETLDIGDVRIPIESGASGHSRLEPTTVVWRLLRQRTVAEPPKVKKCFGATGYEIPATPTGITHGLLDVGANSEQGLDVRGLLEYIGLQMDLAQTRGESPQDALRRVSLEFEAQSRHRAEAMEAILRGDMFSEEEAETALGAGTQTEFEEHRHRSQLIGLPSQDGYRYPKFQFDLQQGDIYEVVGEVNELLGADRDPWGAASWWLYPNEFVGDCPANLLADAHSALPPDGASAENTEDPDNILHRNLIAAAKAVTDPVG